MSLYEAAAKGRVDELGKYFVNGADLNQLSDDGRSALFIAAASGQAQAVTALLEHGATASLGENRSGRTPLHAAALSNDGPTIAALLQKGAKLSAADNDGNTPLHLAAMDDKSIAVQFLLGAGADLKALNARHRTPWRLAYEQNPHSPAASLIAQKAGPMIVEVNSNPSGATVRVGARFEQITGTDGQAHFVVHADEGRVAGTTPCRIAVSEADAGPQGGIPLYLEMPGYLSTIGGVATGTKYPNGETVSSLEPGYYAEQSFDLRQAH
jgi:hypothetical protein